MDDCEYSTLWDALSAIPDPRHARGKQLEWPMILGLIATALVSQQRSVAAIAQWVHAHTEQLLGVFQPACGRLPSEATIRRALHHVDVRQLEQRLEHLHRPSLPAPASPPLCGTAVDGKYVRGAGMHGHPTCSSAL